MVRAMPEDGNRYEVVDGELLVSPAPRGWHQVLVGRLFRELSDYLDEHRVGFALFSPADISWSLVDLVQPDLFVVPLEDARGLEWEGMKRLLLVAEVLSPSTARADRLTKRRLYQRHQIPLYWIVDGDSRQVEIWTPEQDIPVVERHELRWQPDASVPALVLSLDRLFRPV